MEFDLKAPPFDRLKHVRRLGSERSGHGSGGHARHQLYVARDKHDAVDVLIKLTSRPGLVYEQNLTNEVESLTAINEALPDSRYFPFVRDHGHLRDGRRYLVTTLFDELPLAASIGPDRDPNRLVPSLRTAIAVTRALVELHGLRIFHVDLNPMNILHRWEKGAPVIRIVDFESSYQYARHSHGEFYDPPTTPGYAAPELSQRAPDERSDLFSLGAVLYSMIASHRWTWGTDVWTAIESDEDLDAELKTVLLIAVDPDPDGRYESAQELRDSLGTYLEDIWPGRLR